MSLLIDVGRIGIRTILKLRRVLAALIFICFLIGLAFGIYFITSTKHLETSLSKLVMAGVNRQFPRNNQSAGMLLEIIDNDNTGGGSKSINDIPLKYRMNNSSQAKWSAMLSALPPPHYDVHIFYYVWYGNPATDGEYIHWNHRLLPHWNEKEALRWPKGFHTPPDDIGSNFYPSLGPYSSRNQTVMESHMYQIRSAGIGVISVSWYPDSMADNNGKAWDDLVPVILKVAHYFQIKVCFHIEPYKNRNAQNLKEQIKYIIKRYGKHPAFYRRLHNGKHLPLFYIYDSYLTSSTDWSSVFKPGRDTSIRGTEFDAIILGLLVEQTQKSGIVQSGFDGFYTYFASDGFSHGSSSTLWHMFTNFANANRLVFVPSVGPGYIDTRVRPWNAHNTKDRLNGGYYERMFGSALVCKPPIVSITSFNEWHEGTQIERAQPKSTHLYKYMDYGALGPDFYLKLTKKWVDKYRTQMLSA